MKNLVVTLFAAFVLVALLSCGGKTEDTASATKAEEPKKEATSGETHPALSSGASNRKGRLIYKQYCVICHGADGKLGISDAKDLSVSTIDMEERLNQITNGKGLMTPYKDILSGEQIQSVADYLDELKQ